MTKYPLSWPNGWRRTPASSRTRARFNNKERVSYGDQGNSYLRSKEVTIAEGTWRILHALHRFGIVEQDAIISTNLELRLDGLPRSGQPAPADPGVAVYWKKRKDRTHKVMAIDRYDRVADNLAAIAATLEAMRLIDRHGGAVILDRAFLGFEALPSPNDWRHVLGFDKTPDFEEAKQRFRQLAAKQHPDKGGSEQRMTELNRAWGDCQRELKEA